MKVLIPIAIGELFDRLSILALKEKNLPPENKEGLANVIQEKELLEQVLSELKLEAPDQFRDRIFAINEALWIIEDQIREKERSKEFDQEFIELARSVYITNDKRFLLKEQINDLYGSTIKEVKSYEKY